MREMHFVWHDGAEGEHGPGCNCLDCWIAHARNLVDERGVPLESGGEAHGPDCSCPECQKMENEVIVDRRGRPVDFKREWRRESRKLALKRVLGLFLGRRTRSRS